LKDKLNHASSYLWSLIQEPIPSFNQHHIIIVAILILDLATVVFVGPPSTSVNQALHSAYLQGQQCGLFKSVLENFPETHDKYTYDQYHAFILQNRLGKEM